MSGRAYPIWNEVQACIYQSSKSWGARNAAGVTVYIGSSAANSHEFMRHCTSRRTSYLDDGREVTIFTFNALGHPIREVAILNDKSGRANGAVVWDKVARIGKLTRNKHPRKLT